MHAGSGTGRIVAGLILSAAAGGWAVAADTRPTLDVVQAQCIQEAMLHGVIGEGLKGYVDACVKRKDPAALQDAKPQPTDTPAC